MTPHFTEEELTATSAPYDNLLPEHLRRNLMIVANNLEKIRDVYCRPISINSGYRSKEVNRHVGGSATSLHLSALAVDINVANFTVKELPRLFQAILDTDPYELYQKSRDMIHISWHPEKYNIQNDCLTF